MVEQDEDEFPLRPIDEARREQLRRDPRIRHGRNPNPVLHIPTLQAHGVDDIRQLLDRDEDERSLDDGRPSR